MNIFLAITIVVFAGFINGSFAFPLKYIKKWNDETIWFMFSFVSFLILPFFTLLFTVPNAMNVIYTIPTPIITLLILGGFAFGIGQACYSYSFKLIGIGLNCVINISIGTTSTALIGLILKPHLIGSLYSYMQITGIIVFITALILGVLAGKKRVLSNIKHKKIGSGCIKTPNKKYFFLGIILAAMGGFGVAAEGAAYIIANPIIVNSAKSFHISSINANTISWIVLFSFAFTPYMLYFLVLNLKNIKKIRFKPKILSYWIFILIMGCFYWFPLIMFSKAADLIGGDLAPTIAWPLFMIFVILASIFWGVIQGEWKNTDRNTKKLLLFSVLLLIAAVAIFAISSAVLSK
ncbi:MAG: hypothetical protein GY756_07585 [bacterium]|nr:hypothetical protein [bacterium]